MFDIPNSPDTSNFNQAEPDAGDFHALGARGSGIIFGAAVTSQTAPAMAVDVATGIVTVGGVRGFVVSGAVTVQTSESNPRFDLVVYSIAGGTAVIKGAASTNPRFPVFDPNAFLLLAVIYVRSGASTIIATDIIDKRITQETSFQRSYATDTELAIDFYERVNSNQVTMTGGGNITWGSNVLKRLSDVAMEWTTALRIKAAGIGAVLTLKAGTVGTPESQQLLKIEPAGGTTTLAQISGTGVATFANLQNGSGSPQGALVAPTGTMYVDMAAGVLWIKTTPTGNTGWTRLLGDSGGQVLPTATLVPSMDPAVTTTPPTGFLYCNGSLFSATTYPTLAVKIPSLRVPDLRGRIPIGALGTAAVALGATAGALNKALAATEMPVHSHPIHDPKHVHPVQGSPYYNDRLTTTHTNLRPNISESTSIPTMDVNLIWWDASAATGVTVQNAGGGQAFSLLNPVMGVHWLIKT